MSHAVVPCGHSLLIVHMGLLVIFWLRCTHSCPIHHLPSPHATPTRYSRHTVLPTRPRHYVPHQPLYALCTGSKPKYTYHIRPHMHTHARLYVCTYVYVILNMVGQNSLSLTESGEIGYLYKYSKFTSLQTRP